MNAVCVLEFETKLPFKPKPNKLCPYWDLNDSILKPQFDYKLSCHFINCQPNNVIPQVRLDFNNLKH